MFIRTKKIYGQDYAYLVKNSWTGGGARQKVAKYLGKVHRPEKVRNKTFQEHISGQGAEDYFNSREFKEILNELIKLELHNHGLDDQYYVVGSEFKTLSGKDIVVAMNTGHLCTDTVKVLHDYKTENDDGFMLASLITAAGLNVEQEIFVLLFEKAKAESAQQPKGEFYY